MRSLPHPIPYQGSKRRLAPIIGCYLPKGIETFFEPFAGSAAMTIYAAHHRRAKRFVVADSHKPLVALLSSIVEKPRQTAARYCEVWEGQKEGEYSYFNEVRDRYNAKQDPVDLLYLICRCVKNAVRFNRDGRFTQSVDNRRLGMHPEKMLKAVVGVSLLLRGRAEFRDGDWKETSADATPNDFVYLDPPYLGVSLGKDKRYHQQVVWEELIVGLEGLRGRSVPFALSYDGMTGDRWYGPPLPETLGLTHHLIDAGTSAQATLSGRNEKTIESLYVTPGLTKSTDESTPSMPEQLGLAVGESLE